MDLLDDPNFLFSFDAFISSSSSFERKKNENNQSLADNISKEDKMKEYFLIHSAKSKFKQKKVRIKKANKEKEILSNILNREDFLIYKKNQDEEKKAKKERARQGLENGVKIIIDCSYEKNMIKKEITSLCKQICLSCAAMRKSKNPLSINLANCNQELKRKLVLMGSHGWALNIFDEDILSIDFVQKLCSQKNSKDEELMKEKATQKNYSLNIENNNSINESNLKCHQYSSIFLSNIEKEIKCQDTINSEINHIIYLSPDSENYLQKIEKNHIYIIGGMVDKTIKKNLSLEKAQKLGLHHAKLPIDQFLDKNQRKPLNIDTVVLLMSEFLKEDDWERSFFNVCPARIVKKEMDIIKN